MKITAIIEQMHKQPQKVRFSDLQKVCSHYFGQPRNNGTSHYVYKMPWFGDPRINIQNQNGRAKIYQIKQALQAIEKIIEESKYDKP